MLPVTIIITTYQDANLIEPAIRTACESGANEVIVVDDGSSDKFKAILHETYRKFIKSDTSKPSVECVLLPHNLGLSAARNTGIALARNELILPLDADDYLFSGAVKALVDGIGNADIAYGDMWDGRNVCKAHPGPITKDLLLRINPLFATSLFRKSAWQKAGGYRVRPHPFYEDFSMWVTAFLAGCKFQYVPFKVYTHTDRPDSMLKRLHSRTDEFKLLATAPLRGEYR